MCSDHSWKRSAREGKLLTSIQRGELRNRWLIRPGAIPPGYRTALADPGRCQAVGAVQRLRQEFRGERGMGRVGEDQVPVRTRRDLDTGSRSVQTPGRGGTVQTTRIPHEPSASLALRTIHPARAGAPHRPRSKRRGPGALRSRTRAAPAPHPYRRLRHAPPLSYACGRGTNLVALAQGRVARHSRSGSGVAPTRSSTGSGPSRGFAWPWCPPPSGRRLRDGYGNSLRLLVSEST